MNENQRQLTVADQYHLLTRQVRKLIKSVESRGGLERVMIALADYPLENDKPRMLSTEEWLLFGTFLDLFNKKDEVIALVLKEKLSKEGETTNVNEETSEGLATNRDSSQEQE